jgi:serine/threonine protein kinase
LGFKQILTALNTGFVRDGAITIALEYMDGGSLANVLDQVGPIPERVLASIAYQILWGLAYLKHDKRVHRDIKPSNLLINSRGEVKVCRSSCFFVWSLDISSAL